MNRESFARRAIHSQSISNSGKIPPMTCDAAGPAPRGASADDFLTLRPLPGDMPEHPTVDLFLNL
jgi:hypothetical protein